MKSEEQILKCPPRTTGPLFCPKRNPIPRHGARAPVFVPFGPGGRTPPPHLQPTGMGGTRQSTTVSRMSATSLVLCFMTLCSPTSPRYRTGGEESGGRGGGDRWTEAR